MIEKLAQLHFRIPKEYKEKFDQIAKEQGMSSNKLGLEAIATIISKYYPDKSIPHRHYAYNTNEKVKDIHKDIKSIQKDISNLFSTASSIEQQLKDINSTLSTHSDYKEFEEKMESLSKDLRVIKWFFAPFALYDSYEE